MSNLGKHMPISIQQNFGKFLRVLSCLLSYVFDICFKAEPTFITKIYHFIHNKKRKATTNTNIKIFSSLVLCTTCAMTGDLL